MGWIMKPDRLGKILTEMETRITRAQKEGRGGDLDVLKAAVRRCRTKLDKLNPANVAELKALVGKITSSTNPLGLSNLISGLEIGLNQLSPDDLLEATPGQKLAAFQFGFDGDALTVIDQPIMPYENERNIAMASREAAIQNGVHVNDDLLATNILQRSKRRFPDYKQQCYRIRTSYRSVQTLRFAADMCSWKSKNSLPLSRQC